MAGATALCIAPEPTGLTKAGCAVIWLLVHIVLTPFKAQPCKP